MIPKEPKETRWPYYTPGIFSARRWVKEKMLPLPYDKAIMKKQKITVLYVIVTAIGFNYMIYRRFIDRPDLVNKEIETVLSISHDKDATGKLFSFEGSKLSKVEYFERNTLEPENSKK